MGFDRRIVRYEEVHGIRPTDFDLLCSSIELKEGDTVLDLGCGYGAVTRELHARAPKANINYVLLDSSQVQLGRAREEFVRVFGHAFLDQHATLIQTRFPRHPFAPASFDKIVAKMFLHELPEHEHAVAVCTMRDLLKKDGELVLWELALDPSSAPLIRSIVRRKDEERYGEYLTKRVILEYYAAVPRDDLSGGGKPVLHRDRRAAETRASRTPQS